MAGDLHFDKVVLACHFDTAFKDESKGKRAIAAAGNTTLNTSIFKSGGAAASFDGAGDTLSVTDPDAWKFGSGDWTIEYWAKGGSTGVVMTNALSYGGPYGFRIEHAATSVTVAMCNTAGTFISLAFGTSPGSAWFHVAVVRNGTNVTLYIDGVAAATVAAVSTTALYESTVLTLGAYHSGQYFNGQIDDLRITKGVARVTANFTPPAEQLPFYAAQISGVVKDSNGDFARRLVRAHRRDNGAFVSEALSHPTTGVFDLPTMDTTKHYVVAHDSDAWMTHLPFDGENDSVLFPEWGGKKVTANGNVKISTAQSKFGGASAYFDGTGDYLSIVSGEDFVFGTADFTIETWVRLNALGTERAIFDSRSVATDTGIYFCINSANQLIAFGNNGGIASGTTALSATTWHHVALVKDAGTVRLFLDGVLVGSGASTYPITCPGSVLIGRKNGSTTNDFSGYMDDYRISDGVARYTAGFTPPAVPHSVAMQMTKAMAFDFLTPV